MKSLLILSVTGGNWQIIPTRGSSLKNALRGLLNSDDEGKASIDVHFHFCKTTRRARHGGEDLESLLVKEYMSTMKVHGRQRPEGEAGHINACWTHNVSDKEIESIRSGEHHVQYSITYTHRGRNRFVSGLRMSYVTGQAG